MLWRRVEARLFITWWVVVTLPLWPTRDERGDVARLATSHQNTSVTRSRPYNMWRMNKRTDVPQLARRRRYLVCGQVLIIRFVWCWWWSHNSLWMGRERACDDYFCGCAVTQSDRRIHSAEHIFSLGYITDLLVDRPLFILFPKKYRSSFCFLALIFYDHTRCMLVHVCV